MRSVNFMKVKPLPTPEGGTVEGVLCTTFAFDTNGPMDFIVPAEQFTLPEIWNQLTINADFAARREEVCILTPCVLNVCMQFLSCNITVADYHTKIVFWMLI